MGNGGTDFVKEVGEKATQGNLVGLVFDNRIKLDKFLSDLLERYPDVKIVDEKCMQQAGPLNGSLFVRVRGGSIQ